MKLSLSVEQMKKLEANGYVENASKWLDQQDDPFGVISSMRNSGNLPLILAYYRGFTEDEHDYWCDCGNCL